jgi:hypothetical protein
MADNLLMRALKRVGNEIISVSLKALIIMTATAMASAAVIIWLALRGSPHSPWFYAAAGALCSALVNVLALAGLVSWRIWKNKTSPRANESQGVDLQADKQTVDKLNECESMVRHWKDEVRKVRLHDEGQIKIRDDQLSERGGKIAELEQKLRVAKDKLDEFTTPRGRLKIKRAEYHMLGKVGIDVTEILDQMVLDEKLVLSVLYNDLFRPDPQRGVPKHLTIEFSHGIREFSVTVPENTKLTLPFPYQ